ncbi:phage hypothetical protein [Lentilactobacillus parafarraginis F0439]|uniref:YopX protein domain-containing protein n=1 Tax=Lentilactobacillus parafarraginis F0439 TaxID=797515 RepID=G9ZRR8_9LACO|nr:YopX family protein [Lentilactobacillus parafarraginis]EHL96286.1 phage hypothetical protein [Lentilactobacillus parafarraginis F0439]
MSREIKFRAWNSVTKEMEQVTQINLKNHYVQTTFNKIGYSYGQPDDVIVEQYTGLEDANGKDIYEGDVLENPKIRSVVKFGSGIFYADVIGAVNRLPLAGEWQTSVVIGNAHSNPELLEAAK